MIGPILIFCLFIGTCGLIEHSSSTEPFLAITFFFISVSFYLFINNIYLEIYAKEANEDLVKKLELPTELIFDVRSTI
jgi:hypothetical protein